MTRKQRKLGIERILAVRYLTGKKQANLVPVLSKISMIAIAISAGAMIVLFSVFNGFEALIQDLYKALYPDLKISPVKGKFFDNDRIDWRLLQDNKAIRSYSKVIQDRVFLQFNDEQQIASLWGIDEAFTSVNPLSEFIYEGNLELKKADVPAAVIGLHLANKMGIQLNNAFNIFQVYYPNPEASQSALDPLSSLYSARLRPEGVFSIQDEFDGQYVFTDYETAQALFNQPGKTAEIHIALYDYRKAETVKAELLKQFGDQFEIKTRYEQNSMLYRMMKAEKWAVYAILSLVLFIASFNMTGALTLLVLGKKKDIAILQAMGLSARQAQRVFILEGLLWALIGALTGLIAGSLLLWGQIRFGWVKLYGSFIIDAYPVQVIWTDYLLIIATVLIIGLFAVWYPSRRARKMNSSEL